MERARWLPQIEATGFASPSHRVLILRKGQIVVQFGRDLAGDKTVHGNCGSTNQE